MVFAESIRSLTANLSTTVAATMTVLIGMFLLGLFIALGTWVLSWSDHAADKLRTKVFLCTDTTCPNVGEVTPAQINNVRIRLLETPGVKNVLFVSKEQALGEMKRRTPELVEGLTSNPLPASFEVTPKRPEDIRAISNSIRTQQLAGVERVRDGEKVADRIVQVATAVSTFFLIAVIVLVVASTLLIANTIRLSIFSRRREIEVMKLVGATNWFVRGPFMIEGLICGVVGAVAAVILLLLGKAVVVRAVLDRLEADSEVQAIAFGWNAVALVAVGLLLGQVFGDPGGASGSGARTGPLSEDEVRSAAEAFATAYGNEDPAALRATLARNVVRVLPGGRSQGRDQVVDQYQRQFDGKVGSYDLNDLTVTGGRVGRATGNYHVDRKGGDPYEGQIVFGVIRERGEPRIQLIAARPSSS